MFSEIMSLGGLITGIIAIAAGAVVLIWPKVLTYICWYRSYHHRFSYSDNGLTVVLGCTLLYITLSAGATLAKADLTILLNTV